MLFFAFIWVLIPCVLWSCLTSFHRMLTVHITNKLESQFKTDDATTLWARTIDTCSIGWKHQIHVDPFRKVAERQSTKTDAMRWRAPLTGSHLSWLRHRLCPPLICERRPVGSEVTAIYYWIKRKPSVFSDASRKSALHSHTNPPCLDWGVLRWKSPWTRRAEAPHISPPPESRLQRSVSGVSGNSAPHHTFCGQF